MAYHIDNKNLLKCNAAPQKPSLELEMLKNRYENAIKKAEEAKQLFEQKALGLDNNQNLAAANAQLVEQVLPTLRGGLQTKEVAPADIEQVVTPDDGYLGLSRVKIAPFEDILFVRTICSTFLSNQIEKLIDSSNSLWVCNKADALSSFASLTELRLNCSALQFRRGLILPHSIKKLELPFLKKIFSRDAGITDMFYNLSITELYLPELEQIETIGYEIYRICSDLQYCVVANFPKLHTISINRGGDSITFFYNCPKLQEIHLPKLRNNLDYGTYGFGLLCPKLILIEIGENFPQSITLPKWAPTEALNDNTDLIEDTDRCATNREQFFVNFVEYILHRLQNRTGASKLTLTLSATVYDAIFSDESGFEYEGQPIGDYVTSYIAAVNWSVAKAS